MTIASGGHQNTYGGGNADAFLAKLGDLPICVPSSFSFNDTVCQGSAYLFNGINRTITGTYKDTLQNAAGCDSIITLNLTIKQATSNIQTVSACGSYLFNNQTITQSGTYKDTLQNAAGCDSIITLNLTIKQATSNIQTVSACGSYLFNNQTITQSGTYKDTLQNAAGCDSIVTLNLTIKKATSSTKTVSACGSYLFNNQTITQSGTYKDTLPNTAGCDSIITLNLTIKTVAVSKQTVKACGSYVFNNQTLTQSGIYKDTLLNAAGCDSIITLNLTISTNPSPIVTASGFNLTTQSFASYQWQLNGNNIAGSSTQNYTATANGSYTVHVTDANGCTATSPAIQVTGVGIRDIDDFLISIYPSPALNLITVEAESKIASISIYDLTGKLVLKLDDINAFEKKVDIHSLSSATYHILVKTVDGKNSIRKFIKE
jgi:hypothetical protein